MITALVALAGGVGASTRFVLDGAIRRRVASRLPVATMTINVTGSLLLGLVTGLVLHHGVSPDLRLVLGTGFCGGYTTFGTASVETVRLAQGRHLAAALAAALGTAVLCLLAAALGLVLTA